ncbi:DUF4112 domain-containing protein (plasmid) [Halorussus salilacus]|uniref:DUF4112 domain-containing protein n=1 Tax=Halorussus salilacus TaxID=2953750 RepID=UPI0020A0F4B5|nr:DUF4112 domain-containing protein [Halorussus salilacus]USZ69736.1 DUF4112 domain-containing protein [Halorussus salilacus]
MGTDSEREGQSIDVAVEDEPPGMERVRTISTLLDEAFEIPVINYKIGLDPIMGILPVGGDTVSAAISLYTVGEAARMGASRETLLKMLVNIGVDTVIGSIPAIGTVFDAVFKANERNVALLEEEFGISS